MQHPYKNELFCNLKKHFSGSNWQIIDKFSNGQDEILLVVPNQEDLAQIYTELYTVLRELPDINYPAERTLISLCHPDGSGYCSKVINPNRQDEIHQALLGKLPSRSITRAELSQHS